MISHCYLSVFHDLTSKVVANSIGYGHKMVAHSFVSKIFMTFYFLVAT